MDRGIRGHGVEVRRSAKPLTLAEYAAGWTRSGPPSTRLAATSGARALAAHWPTEKIGDITTTMVKAMLHDMEERGLSVSTPKITHMSKAKGRKSPHRKPIPARRLSRDATSQTYSAPRLPVVTIQESISWINGNLPATLAPLYATIGAFLYDTGGSPARSCIPMSYQMGRTLQLLGFEAEILVACASVFRRDVDAETRVTDVGVWDHPPSFHPQHGTYSGHVVLWLRSLHRILDPTIAQDSYLQQNLRSDWKLGLPVVLELPEGVDAAATTPVAFRGNHVVSYMLSREYVATLDPFWSDKSRIIGMERAAKRMSERVLEILTMIEKNEPDRWMQTNSHLRQLLDGRLSLPTDDELLNDPAPWRKLVSDRW